MAILFDPTDMPPTGRLLHTGSEGLESCRGVSTLLSLDTAHHHNRLIQPHKPGHGLYWTTDVTCELPVRVAESGPGSLPPITVVDFFADTVRRYPERPALAFQPHFVPKVTAGRSSSSSSAKDEEEKRREQEEGKEEKDDGGTILTSLPARPNLDTAPPPSYVCGPIPGWCMYTWQGYWNDVCMFAKGLLYLGCERRSRIAIMGCNSPAWAIAYFGSIFIDGVAVGVYTTNSVDATRHVVRHARCRVAVVDSLVNLEKMLQVKKLQQKQREERALRKLHGPYSNSTKKSDIDKNEAGQAQQDDDPSRKRKRDTPSSSSSSLRQMNQGGGAGLGRRENQGGIASKEEKEEEEEAELGACDELQMIVVYRDRVPPGYENDGVISFEDFLQLGLSVNDAILTARMESLKPGQCCSLVYTSGTTGYPKGVMLSHDNFTWTAACSSQMMKLDSSHHLVSFLPLSHVAAQLVDLYMPVTMGCCAYFARPDSLQGTLIETVKAVRPTWFLAVPRVWEKIELKLKEIAAQRGSTGLKKRIADWAKDVGYRGTDALLTGKDGAVPTTFPIVMKLILNQVRKALGMDRCLGLGSCAAPLDPVTQRYFMSLGMPINSIYGLSESTGPQTFILPAPGW
ncbi:very long-chain acyl [Cystoisospora suis]|uniref:Very long-chain acyl n=1 Tax=Cystoisospora suis TaxID=483139 RepID=A0A2C6KH23_9APIC|nr:very long-chain acyl [Cystoisospora suis]